MTYETASRFKMQDRKKKENESEEKNIKEPFFLMEYQC